eukprot:TCALIF_11990-PA protein Name:"Protein of unknown function" AED:0.24 eAED:0.24 QI:1/1/0/1/0/0.5/2/0/111
MVQVNSFAGFVPCIGTGPYLPPVFRRRVYLCVLFMIFVIDYSQNLVNGLKCYTDVDGKQITTCKETEGFRTCFTKYNDSKYLVDKCLLYGFAFAHQAYTGPGGLFSIQGIL